jgi:hypothetical protein
MAGVERQSPVSRLGAIAVMAVAITATAGWYLSPITHQDSPSAPLQEDIASSGVTHVTPVLAASMVVKSRTPDSVVVAPPTHTAAISSGITSSHQPPVDLATAIQHARADVGSTPAPLPPGVVSWQGMTQEQAAKAFESAVQEYSRSITAKPFRSEVGKN